MPYQEETIKTIVDRLNMQYFLPSIQRRYIWKPDKVLLLFDSIMRGYPISSFLFWELEQKNRDKWEVYKFCEKAYADNQGTDHIKLEAAVGKQNLTLVLDGQQRLTSLLLGLKGTFAIRRNRQRYVRSQYPVCRLYLDLFADPTPNDDEGEFSVKPYYSFDWHEKVPTNDENHWWYQVGRILDCHDEDKFYKMRETEELAFPKGVSKASKNLFERNFGRLYQAIHKDTEISYYIERNQDYDRVLDIFVRANIAGVALTKPEIILSMLESKMKKGAKNRINALIEQVNNDLPRKNRIDLEFVLRSCLVLGDLPVRYRINTFTNKNIELVEGLWPKFQNAIVRTLKLVNRFGLDRNNLTGMNVLIPLVLYLYRNPGVSFLGTSPFESRNADLMRRWLILAMLNKVFGRGAEQVLANLRHVIQDCPAGDDFPAKKLNVELKRMRFATELDEEVIQAYLDSEYPVQFLKLSLLYDDHFWDAVEVQQDHIFPQALFSRSNPGFAALPPKKQELFKSLSNKAANIQPLMDTENNEKRAKSFDQWIHTRDNSFRKIHLIPKEDALLEFKHFDKFIEAREALIVEKLKKVI